MSVPPDWLTPEDVGAYLDLPAAAVGADDNLALATATVKSAVEERRSDLFDRTQDPPVFAPTVHVKNGSVMWAALIYQARNSPSGFTGYGDDTAMFDTLGARRAEVMRLLGWRRPAAL